MTADPTAGVEPIDAQGVPPTPAMPRTPTVPRTAGHAGALGTLRRKAWFWAPIAPLIALDLWSKAAAFAFVAAEAPRQREVEFHFLPDPFGFSLVSYQNTGTIWGLGQDLTIALMVLRCAALLVIIWFAAKTPSGRRLQLLVLGLIFAGAVGNLYDNFFVEGRGVRDFLLFFMRGEGVERHVFPAFNVADSCISCGAILLMLLLWREPAHGGSNGNAGPGPSGRGPGETTEA